VLSSHLQGYKGAVGGYASHAAAFFDAARDFLASSGESHLQQDLQVIVLSLSPGSCACLGNDETVLGRHKRPAGMAVGLRCRMHGHTVNQWSIYLKQCMWHLSWTLCHTSCCSAASPCSPLPPPHPPGSPVLYENTLTPEGISAARAATAAASAAATGMYTAESSAAAGVAAAAAHPQSPQAQDKPTSPTGSTGSTTGSTGSAFKAESQVPRLPLMAAAGVSGSSVSLCPGVPSTAALGVAGGLTKVAPAELHLPGQHAALFRWGWTLHVSSTAP
jgi:hypothetical protein